MEVWIYAAFIVFFASSLQAATGFGFSVMATPILLLIFDAVTAIQVNIVLSIFLSATMSLKIAKDVNKELLLNLVIGSTLGVPVGIVAFLYFDDGVVKMLMGILIIFVVSLSIFSFKLTRTFGKDAMAGGVSGALTAGLGMSGPPLMAYFSSINIDKFAVRSTSLVFFLFIYTVSFVFQLFFGDSSLQPLVISFYLLPVLIAGLLFGDFLFHKLSQKMFIMVAHVVLSVSGISLVINSF